MLKRFFCGAVLVAALCGTGTAPTQADELYVRNRPYKDVYFSGGTSYVTIDGFLTAVKMPWGVSGNKLILGRGDSPELSNSTGVVSVVNNGETIELSGVVRDGRLYVPVKAIAEAAGYGVIHNSSTGVTDVVKSRLTTDDDAKLANEIAATRQKEKDDRMAAYKARVEKEKEARKAKEEAAKAKDDLNADEDEEMGDADSKDLDAKGDPDKDVSDTKPNKGKDKDMTVDNSDKDDDASDTADDKKVAKADKESDEKKAPPPKAELVVLSSNAEANNYTGDVVFKAVLQNQGYATATGVQARLVVVGPDGKQWLSKTYYHADMQPDGRWEITENYHHRAASAIPRGDYDVKVVPVFQSAAPKE